MGFIRDLEDAEAEDIGTGRNSEDKGLMATPEHDPHVFGVGGRQAWMQRMTRSTGMTDYRWDE